MVWMEMIRLRTTQRQAQDVYSLLIDSMRQMTTEPGLVQAQVYDNAWQSTDVALSLLWDNDFPRHEGSRAGLSISEILKTFGLVEHSIWLRKTGV